MCFPRKIRKISLVQLDKFSGVPFLKLEGIEKRGDCMVPNALKIAEALDVTMDELYRLEVLDVK